MTTQTTEALHDIHTATNDVLEGYREMAARAQPDIQPLIHRLIDMHQQHASAQETELATFREAGTDDSSWQGTLNKAVVTMRDWVSDLDRDSLPAVRQGEQALRDKYIKALGEAPVREHSSVFSLLTTQKDAIETEITRLPKE